MSKQRYVRTPNKLEEKQARKAIKSGAGHKTKPLSKMQQQKNIEYLDELLAECLQEDRDKANARKYSFVRNFLTTLGVSLLTGLGLVGIITLVQIL